jgi:membrane protein
MRGILPRISIETGKIAFNRWLDHNGGRLGAALACYALLSLAPLLIFLVTLCGSILGRREAQLFLLHQAHQWAGRSGAEAVQSLLHNVNNPASGLFADTIGLITLLFGASRVFSELRDGIDTVWDVGPEGGEALKVYAKDKLFAFGMILAIGFFLLLSLLFSTTLSAILKYFSRVVPVPGVLIIVLNFIIAIYAVTVLFSLIFKYVPRVKIDWADAWNGALVTAILFTLGKMSLAIYLGTASVSSAYGAAGSMVAIVVWVYYSAQIFYYGAEFTWVTAQKRTSLQGQDR